MKSLVISKYASVLAVMTVMTIVLMGADSENGLVFIATKAAGLGMGACALWLGCKWIGEGRIGNVEE